MKTEIPAELNNYRMISAQLKRLLELENPPVAIAFMDRPPVGLKKNRNVVP